MRQGRRRESFNEVMLCRDWKVWEDEVLVPLLDREPDTITYTDYEEL